MAGRQRTFELIPTTLVKPSAQPQRMTSKQVKKAYQKKNKGPRISRAEQHRLDAIELAQQKADYERERTSSRAKAAREKKAAKEQEGRVERKRKGIPEPSKFVRASQPMISMFVKKGNKRSWQEIKEVAEYSDGTVCEQDGQPANRVVVDDGSEDEFGDFPSLSQSNLPEILAKADSPLKIPRGDKLGIREELMLKSDGEFPMDESDLELPPPKVITLKDEYPEDDEQSLADMVTQQLISEAAEVAKKVDDLRSSPAGKIISDATEYPATAVEKASSKIVRPIAQSGVVSQPKSPKFPNNTLPQTKQQATSTIELVHPSAPKPDNSQLLALRDRSVNMTPAALLNKTKKSMPFAATPIKPKYTSFQPPQSMLLPSATQAFLESHLDDFFPSPSQEVRELLKDIHNTPTNTQVAEELDADDTKQDDAFEDMISTQDLILAPQDLLEIDTPSRPPANPTQAQLRSSNPPALQPVAQPRRRFFQEKEDDLLHAALYESRIQAVREEPKLLLLKEAPAKGSRTFQRIQSTLTDYGDEEFNEQELLALC